MVTALGKSEKMGTRKTIFPGLPSVMTMVLGKEFFLKKIQTLPSAGQRALGKEFFLKKNSNFAERRPGGTRQRVFRKKNKTSLPSAE